MPDHDAVIVGARCAGATLALALARRGWGVVLVDRDTQVLMRARSQAA